MGGGGARLIMGPTGAKLFNLPRSGRKYQLVSLGWGDVSPPVFREAGTWRSALIYV